MSENVLNDGLETEETDALQEQKRKQQKKNKTRKVIITTTYFIAVLCLICGLLVPLFQCVEGVDPKNRMMIKYIPAMFNNIFGKELIPIKADGWFLAYPVTGKFDFMSLVGVLYAIVSVLSLLMFVPVLLGSKKKNTSANVALVIEILALLVTGAYIATATYNLAKAGVLKWTDYNFLLAFGGVLLMAVFQTVTSKGSIGVSKVIAVILSVVGVFALLDVTLFIPALATPLNKLSELLHCDDAGFVGGLTNHAGNTNFLGIDGFNILLTIKDSWTTLIVPKGETPNAFKIIVYILLILVALLTILNLVVDVIGLATGKKFNKDRSPCRNKGSNTFALVRYIVTFVFTVAIIIMVLFAMKDVHVGIYLYLLAAVLFIEIINAVVRTACANARAKKGQLAPSVDTQDSLVIADPSFNTEPEAEPEPVLIAEPATETAETTATEPVVDPFVVVPVEPEEQPAYEQTSIYEKPEETAYVPVEEPAAPEVQPLTATPEEVPVEEPTPTVYIYGGDTDEFMETLTDTEKVEFVEVFIKKSKGKVNGVADYVIGGDNSDFFPAVFVHINRYRNMVSDALMSKMYKQLGKVS